MNAEDELLQIHNWLNRAELSCDALRGLGLVLPLLADLSVTNASATGGAMARLLKLSGNMNLRNVTSYAAPALFFGEAQRVEREALTLLGSLGSGKAGDDREIAMALFALCRQRDSDVRRLAEFFAGWTAGAVAALEPQIAAAKLRRIEIEKERG